MAELAPEKVETAVLLRVFDAVDELRDDLNDDEYRGLPQLRTDPLKLHQLAMAVLNEGSRCQVADLFEFTVDLEHQVLGMMAVPEQVQDTLLQWTVLDRESLSYAILTTFPD